MSWGEVGMKVHLTRRPLIVIIIIVICTITIMRKRIILLLQPGEMYPLKSLRTKKHSATDTDTAGGGPPPPPRTMFPDR